MKYVRGIRYLPSKMIKDQEILDWVFIHFTRLCWKVMTLSYYLLLLYVSSPPIQSKPFLNQSATLFLSVLPIQFYYMHPQEVDQLQLPK